MKVQRATWSLISATLISLLILGTPDGRAEVPTDPGNPLAMLVTQSIDSSPTSEPVQAPARTHAMALMGEMPLPPVPEITKQRFRQADAGGSATCGILQGSRRLLCWGRNDFGQASPPVGRYRFVAMGENHGCALTTAGHLRCWGVPTAFPKPDEAKGRFIAVAAGDDHTCAIRANQALTCWGNNDNGELNVPAQKFRQIVARGDHSCGITRDKRLLCWGEKAFTDYSQSILVPVKKVATGQLHACALGVDGLAKCWGNGIHGENQAPADHFIDIVAGDWHTCGLRPDHTALCWGRNQYGQTQLGMDKYRLIAGGGMQTCGILRGNRHLTCHGSFANNEVMYPLDAAAARQASYRDGEVRPQLAFLTIFTGITGMLNTSIVNGGKMLDGKMAKWEKVGWTTQLVGLFTNMFIGWFGPKPEDPTVKIFDILKDIQADIRKVEKGIDELKSQLNRTELALLQSWCDGQLEEYGSAYNLLEGEAYGSDTGARKAYVQLLKAQEAALTRSIDQHKIVTYPTAELEKFRNRYLDQLKSARNKLTNALIGSNGVKTATFSACFRRGHAEWRDKVSVDARAYPFDDRPIYDHVYQILRGAMAMQGEMLGMEQDVEMQQAYQKLVESRADNVPVVEFNPQEHALGFCLYADERKVISHPEHSPRWVEVAEICQQNRDRIQSAYIDLVKQVEFVGGAYSDDQVVLSMTAEQMGLDKANDRNWLWMRNIPDQTEWLSKPYPSQMTGKWMDFQSSQEVSPFWGGAPFPWASDAGIYYYNRGCWNSVCKDESFGEGVWHSNAQAWEDIYGFRKGRRDAANLGYASEDLLGSMNSLEDPTTDACQRDTNGNCKLREISPGKFEPLPGPRLKLFNGIGNKPFWLIGKSFTYNARSRLDIPLNYVTSETGENIPMKCFVAEEVNGGNKLSGPGYYQPQSRFNSYGWVDWGLLGEEKLYFTGRVCNTDEMGATLARQKNASAVKDAAVKDCNDSNYNLPGSFGYPSFCAGFGYGDTLRYRFALGWMVTKARFNEYTFKSNYFVVDKYLQQYKPYTDGNLYHMPVVDISKRKCKPKMVGSGTRDANRDAGGVKIPSICGEDMDKLIQAIVPRPEFPPVPENVVRLPEVN